MVTSGAAIFGRAVFPDRSVDPDVVPAAGEPPGHFGDGRFRAADSRIVGGAKVPLLEVDWSVEVDLHCHLVILQLNTVEGSAELPYGPHRTWTRSRISSRWFRICPILRTQSPRSDRNSAVYRSYRTVRTTAIRRSCRS